MEHVIFHFDAAIAKLFFVQDTTTEFFDSIAQKQLKVTVIIIRMYTQFFWYIITILGVKHNFKIKVSETLKEVPGTHG